MSSWWGKAISALLLACSGLSCQWRWRPRVLILADRTENRHFKKYRNCKKYSELGGMQKNLYVVTAILGRQCHMRGVLTWLMVSAYEELIGRSTTAVPFYSHYVSPSLESKFEKV